MRLVAVAVIIVTCSVGCTKSRSERCNSRQAEWARAAKAFGGRVTSLETEHYMKLCHELSEEDFHCLPRPEMLLDPSVPNPDSKCEAVLEQWRSAFVNKAGDELEWEERSALQGFIRLLVPKGWQWNEHLSLFEPPQGSSLDSFDHRILVQAPCASDGRCVPRTAAEWESEFDAFLKLQIPMLGGERLRDERLGNNARVVTLSSGRHLHLLHGTWREGAARLVICDVKIDGASSRRLTDFERSCREAEVRWPQSGPVP
jgi:hypothetical protein